MLASVDVGVVVVVVDKDDGLDPVGTGNGGTSEFSRSGCLTRTTTTGFPSVPVVVCCGL